MHPAEAKVPNNSSFISRCLVRISPSLARESQRLDRITHRSSLIIQSYSDLSDKIKQEVDENHFSQLMNYEKQAK